MLCAHVQFRNRLGGQVIVRRVVSCSGELGAVWGVYRRHLGWRRPLSGTAGRWPSSHFMRICGAVELCFMYFSMCYTSQLKISKSKKKDNMSKERQCSPRPQGAVWKCGSRGILWSLWWIGTRCGYRVAATQDGTFSNVSRTCTVTSVTQNAGSTFHQTLHVNSMVLSLRCHLKTLQSFLWGCLAKSASLADAIQVAGTGCSEDLIVPEATPHFILQFHFTRQTPGRPLGARAQLLLRSQSAILLPSRFTPVTPVPEHSWLFSGTGVLPLSIPSWALEAYLPCLTEGSSHLLPPSPVICMWFCTVRVSSEMEFDFAFLLLLVFGGSFPEKTL